MSTDREVEQAIEAAESACDKVRVFSITVTVPAEHAERIDKELEDFLFAQCDATPGYVCRYSYKDEEV